MKTQGDISFQQSIERTLKLLNHFGNTLEPMNVTEISHFLGISRSTAYSMLRVLTQYNFLSRSKDTGKFFLGYQTFILGSKARSRFQNILPCDDYLVSFISQMTLPANNVGLWTLEADYRVLLALFKLPGKPMRALNNLHVQRVLPSFCTACGKMLLSELPLKEQREALEEQSLIKYTDATVTDPEAVLQQIAEAGRQKYCVDIEGFSNFEVNIAAPVRGQTGRALAALNLSVSKLIYLNRPMDYIQMVTALGKELSSLLGYTNQLI